MRILAIETSCDETSIAVVSMSDGVFTIEKNITSSQAKIHAQYGGVVPEVAAREHAAWIIPLLQEVGIAHDGTGIDAVAVTAGPGLVPALRVGVELAKTLAWAWHKPLVAVNHLEGHIYSVWLNPLNAPRSTLHAPQPYAPQLPALCLLVSGGHTELILMRDHGQYELLGMTRDDAAGEAFDKVAKLLGMEYPGGPQIFKAALEGDASAIDFPRPMIDSKDLDFSFSGLKTAVRVYLESSPPLAKGRPAVRGSEEPSGSRRGGVEDVSVEDVSASFQQAVVDVLVAKTLRAAQLTQPKSIILSGGVSANSLLRQTLANEIQSRFSGVSDEAEAPVKFYCPDLSLTGDNAAMIGAAGLMKASRGEFVDPLTLVADPNMRLA